MGRDVPAIKIAVKWLANHNLSYSAAAAMKKKHKPYFVGGVIKISN